jgi:glucosamine-6-phosphate deaminase
MQLFIEPDPAAWARTAAAEVAGQVRVRPGSALGLATGNTTGPLYGALIDLVQRGELDLSAVTTFTLDEYVGLARDHRATCWTRLQTELYSMVAIPAAQVNHPDTGAADLEAECRAYERRIVRAGGIDLQLLGIGENGHVGFNEPGTPFGSRTHVAEITAVSMSVRQGSFTAGERQPHQGLTLGLKTIMQARKVLLLAWGGHKRAIVARALEGPVTPEVPASVLQLHPNLMVILDEAAAGDLSAELRKAG